MSDDEDDPFERLDESVGDREGDPFERLDDEEEQAAESEAGNDPGESGTEWYSDSIGPETEASEDGTETETEPGYDAHNVTPADHLDEVDEQPDGNESYSEFVEQEEPSVDTGSTVTDTTFKDMGAREGDPFEGDVFEQMDVGELDPDEVWASIAEAEEEGSVSQQQERVYAEVSKHRYCEQCEFFSDPPDVHCSHDGTEILEFLDQKTVRVVDCPVVAERKELEKHE